MTNNNITPTPQMTQYRKIRAELQSEILLAFRLGDFYHFFDDDAAQVETLLTDHHGIDGEDKTEPAHSIAILATDSEQTFKGFVGSGYAVAVCEGLQPATGFKAGRSIQPYEVVKIMRPSISDFINSEHPPVITCG